MIGNFITRQLPYPALSFEMVHCAQCGIVWDKKDWMLLLEVDWVLKPGDYFVLTSSATQPFGSSLSMKNSMLTPMEESTPKICWTLKLSNMKLLSGRKLWILIAIHLASRVLYHFVMKGMMFGHIISLLYHV